MCVARDREKGVTGDREYWSASGGSARRRDPSGSLRTASLPPSCGFNIARLKIWTLGQTIGRPQIGHWVVHLLSNVIQPGLEQHTSQEAGWIQCLGSSWLGCTSPCKGTGPESRQSDQQVQNAIQSPWLRRSYDVLGQQPSGPSRWHGCRGQAPV